MAITQSILLYMESYSYLSIFIFATLSGYLIPIPEEIVLVLAGYVSAYLSLNPYLVASLVIIGIMLGDNILFLLSRNGNRFIKKIKGGGK